MIFSGKAVNHPIMQVLELPEDKHPFFIATQAHAELTSRPLRPDPMFLGLIRAALIHSGADDPAGQKPSGKPPSPKNTPGHCNHAPA